MNTNTTDREQLELAAKAANLAVEWHRWPSTSRGGFYILNGLISECSGPCYNPWNPLTDDGDRYRLARTLNMNIEFDTKSVGAKLPNGNWMWIGWGDGSSDGRHKTDADAILALAAEIGRQMP